MNSSSVEAVARVTNRRRKKCVRSGIQLKIALMVLSVSVIVLAVNFQLNMLALSDVSNRAATTSPTALVSLFQETILKQFIVAACFVVPLSLWVGIVYAFKFCGPLYRFAQFFEGLSRGPWTAECRLRKGDDLQDLAHAINQVVREMVETVDTQQILLKKARPLLEQALATDEQKAIRDGLLEAIDRQMEVTELRLRADSTQEAVDARLESEPILAK